MILRLPCTRHSKDDEKFIYIPYDELPREPHITLVTIQISFNCEAHNLKGSFTAND